MFLCLSLNSPIKANLNLKAHRTQKRIRRGKERTSIQNGLKTVSIIRETHHIMIAFMVSTETCKHLCRNTRLGYADIGNKTKPAP